MRDGVFRQGKESIAWDASSLLEIAMLEISRCGCVRTGCDVDMAARDGIVLSHAHKFTESYWTFVSLRMWIRAHHIMAKGIILLPLYRRRIAQKPIHYQENQHPSKREDDRDNMNAHMDNAPIQKTGLSGADA